jgi:hypothetical protein
MISRNISSTGVSLLHTEAVEGRLAILLKIPNKPPAQLVVEVVRIIRVGDFFEIAGFFVERL